MRTRQGRRWLVVGLFALALGVVYTVAEAVRPPGSCSPATGGALTCPLPTSNPATGGQAPTAR